MGKATVRNALDSLHWYESQRASRGPSGSDHLVDLEDGKSVLDFTYCYLEAQSRSPSDDKVRKVTAAIALHKGPRTVLRTTLEVFLAGFLR